MPLSVFDCSVVEVKNAITRLHFPRSCGQAARWLSANWGRAQLLRWGAPGGLQGVSDVAWDSASKYLATASDDCTLRLWDAEQGSLLRVLVGHAHYVMCCAFNPAGGLLVRRPLSRCHAHSKPPQFSPRALRHNVLPPAATSS